ncbi:putative serine protease K12H4.7 [Photinus pyralis]|nr:putative serine protease K12H4.7 [Photinus pyralis]
MKIAIIIVFLCLFATLTCAENDTSEDAGNSTSEEVDPMFGNSTFGSVMGDLFRKLLYMTAGITEHWLDVPLDHFNLFDNRTWRMRYLTSDKFFKSGGPLFIEVGGEWTIDGSSLMMGGLAELAQEHNGFLVETEHRYYGKSLPFGKDFSTEKLRYLQMEQALEDLAYFIEHFKLTTPGLANSTVVIRGCSYPGMLVTWMRVRFPHIVDISYASSASLGVGLDYPEYFEVVNDVYANVSTTCIETVRRGFNQTTNLLKTDDGRLQVREAFKDWTCGDIDEMNSMEILGKIIVVLNVMHDPSQYEEVACLTMAIDDDMLDMLCRQWQISINILKELKRRLTTAPICVILSDTEASYVAIGGVFFPKTRWRGES